MSFVGMLYIHASLCCTVIGVSCCQCARLGIVMVIYTHISAWGFDVARFDRKGNFLRASNREASDSAGLHAFFVSSAYL